MALQEHYTYDQVRAILGSKRQANLGNNTYAAMPTFDAEEEGQIDINFHSTNIARLFPTGVAWLNTDGYRTKTTADRIRRFLPKNWALGTFKVPTEHWTLYYKGVAMPYEDGVHLHSELMGTTHSLGDVNGLLRESFGRL